jgi:hypothetical protein
MQSRRSDKTEVYLSAADLCLLELYKRELAECRQKKKRDRVKAARDRAIDACQELDVSANAEHFLVQMPLRDLRILWKVFGACQHDGIPLLAPDGRLLCPVTLLDKMKLGAARAHVGFKQFVGYEEKGRQHKYFMSLIMRLRRDWLRSIKDLEKEWRLRKVSDLLLHDEENVRDRAQQIFQTALQRAMTKSREYVQYYKGFEDKDIKGAVSQFENVQNHAAELATVIFPEGKLSDRCRELLCVAFAISFLSALAITPPAGLLILMGGILVTEGLSQWCTKRGNRHARGFQSLKDMLQRKLTMMPDQTQLQTLEEFLNDTAISKDMQNIVAD